MEFIAGVIILTAVLLFVLFFFSIVAEMIVVFLSGLLLIIILPFAALFDGTDVVKKIKAKRTKKVKEDPRDGPTVTRVSKADLRDKRVHRPTVLRRKQ